MADLDVIVVGAGFAGIYAVHAMREARLTVRIFRVNHGCSLPMWEVSGRTGPGATRSPAPVTTGSR
jgi:predicted NAD/FAD-dependent oxidoreductase